MKGLRIPQPPVVSYLRSAYLTRGPAYIPIHCERNRNNDETKTKFGGVFGHLGDGVCRFGGPRLVMVKNGDHLTGIVEVSDGKNVTLKTDYAGEIQIALGCPLAMIKSDKPIYVVMPDKKHGEAALVTTEGSNIIIHPASGARLCNWAVSQVTVVRGEDQETAYEKSLHPSLLEAWKGGVNLGFALARGNSETTNLTTGFTADRKTMNDEITAYFTSLYSTNDKTGGGTIANSIVGGLKYDHNLTKKVFVFGSGDFTHDELQFLNIRAIYSGGLGYHLISNPTTTLDLLGGINYTHESYGPNPAVVGSIGVQPQSGWGYGGRIGNAQIRKEHDRDGNFLLLSGLEQHRAIPVLV